MRATSGWGSGVRLGGTALGLALVSSLAGAQQGRLFTDSWFWGVKGGATSYSTAVASNVYAPTFGADWLITRTRAGLYVSFDASPLSDVTIIRDPLTSTGERAVNFSGFKRLGLAAAIFPRQFGKYRPYGAIGVGMSFISNAVPDTGYVNSSQRIQDSTVVENGKSRAGILLMGGVQREFRKVSIFGQASVLPGSDDFLIGSSPMYFLELGVRINAGTLIDRPGEQK